MSKNPQSIKSVDVLECKCDQIRRTPWFRVIEEQCDAANTCPGDLVILLVS